MYKDYVRTKCVRACQYSRITRLNRTNVTKLENFTVYILSISGWKWDIRNKQGNHTMFDNIFFITCKNYMATTHMVGFSTEGTREKINFLNAFFLRRTIPSSIPSNFHIPVSLFAAASFTVLGRNRKKLYIHEETGQERKGIFDVSVDNGGLIK